MHTRLPHHSSLNFAIVPDRKQGCDHRLHRVRGALFSLVPASRVERLISLRREIIPWRAALAILLSAVTLLLSPFGNRLEESVGLPFLFAWRGERTPTAPVAILALDEQTSAALSLPDLDQLDRWPRTLYAQMIETLNAHGVAAIVMDIAFLHARDADSDAALAAAMRNAGNVVILKMLETARIDDVEGNTAEWQLEPLPLFANSAAAVGVFTLPDQALKKYTRLFPRTPLGVEAAIPVLALQRYYEQTRTQLPFLLDRCGNSTLAAQLRNESNPALFAATLHAALIETPNLAKRLRAAAASTFSSAQMQALDALLRAYRQPDVTYFNFYGPQRSIPTLSLSDSVKDSNPSALAQLRGKVVFVGLSERLHKQHDYFFTTYSSDRDNRISGVEIAATVFANLFENRVLHVMPRWQQVLLLGGYCALLLIAARRLSALRWLAMTAMIAFGYALLSLWLFVLYAWWIPLFIPVAIVTPAFAVFAIWYYYRDMAQAEHAASEALSLYVPADIVATVRNHRQRFDEHRQIEAFCLLTDIVGFTSLCEQREPAYMHALMNRYYRDIVAEVERYGGVVANIVGDGLLALWPVSSATSTQNADTIRADLATRTCRAALAITAASDRLSNLLGEPLTTCAGIHFGPLSLGHLGAGQHFEYAPVGDTINTTARMEACNRQLQTRILISEAAQQYAKHFELRSHGNISLKGKRDALMLHEVVAEIDQDIVDREFDNQEKINRKTITATQGT